MGIGPQGFGGQTSKFILCFPDNQSPVFPPPGGGEYEKELGETEKRPAGTGGPLFV